MKKEIAVLRTLCAAAAALLLLLPAVAQADTAGLVAAYGLEDTAASAVDSSGRGNTGTIAGATSATARRFGRALSFDGVNDRVDVPYSSSLNVTTGLTLEAWVNPTTSSGSWRTVVMKESPAGLNYALYSAETSNRPSAHVFTTPELDTRGTSALPLNTWSHLAGTYDGATLRLYVNGSQVASKAVTGGIATTNGALRIGGNAIWSEWFKGHIDEVRVYNRALSAAEVAADRDRAVAPGT